MPDATTNVNPTLSWIGAVPGELRLLDQTRLPLAEVALAVRDVETLREAICRLAVRGAPALGVAAGYGVLLGVQDVVGDRDPLRRGLDPVLPEERFGLPLHALRLCLDLDHVNPPPRRVEIAAFAAPSSIWIAPDARLASRRATVVGDAIALG